MLQSEASLITKDLRLNTRSGSQVSLLHADEFLTESTLICDGWFLTIHRNSNSLNHSPVAPDSDSDPPEAVDLSLFHDEVPLLLLFDPAPPAKSL